jgi:hypothetical protein
MRAHRTAVRAAVASAVAAAYPDPLTRPVVSEYPGPTDPPTLPTILVGSQGIDPPNVACPAPLYRCTVVAFVPIVTPGAADDELDELVDVVVAGLDGVGLAWRDVVRGTWLDTLPAYTLTTEGT